MTLCTSASDPKVPNGPEPAPVAVNVTPLIVGVAVPTLRAPVEVAVTGAPFRETETLASDPALIKPPAVETSVVPASQTIVAACDETMLNSPRAVDNIFVFIFFV